MHRIDLARWPDTRLGRLNLRPAVREIVRDDGAHEVVEPRVMQVLLALAFAGGEIVTRDALTASCWDGRIVGEDAINRVISRLRRVAEGIGSGSFRVETITKIGYRLIAPETVPSDPVPSVAPAQDAAPAWPPIRGPDRRTIVLGASAALLGTATLGGWTWRNGGKTPDAAVPTMVEPLMLQAHLAMNQGTPEGTAQAIGFYRHVVALEPDYADGWGHLAAAYSVSARHRDAAYSAAMEMRSRAAAQRAFSLDPRNPPARSALVLLLPRIGHWRRVETEMRDVLADRPDEGIAVWLLAGVMRAVGRCREAARLYDRAVGLGPPTPAHYLWVHALWAANRLDEADAAMARIFALFPKNFAVWFSKFYVLVYTDRFAEAIAMANDVDGRPNGIPKTEFDNILSYARAMRSRMPAELDAAVQRQFEAAHRGAGYAENSMQFSSAAGRLDLAFAAAQAYFFGRGFSTGDLRFSAEQGGYTRHDDRRTYVLFLPSTAAMRRDPRFGPLVREIGLEAYWKEAQVQPDFRRPDGLV